MSCVYLYSATSFHVKKYIFFYKTLDQHLLKSFTCKAILFNRLLASFCFAFLEEKMGHLYAQCMSMRESKGGVDFFAI